MKSERKRKKHKRKLGIGEEEFIIEQIMNHKAHLVYVRHDGKFLWLVRRHDGSPVVAVTDKDRLKVSNLLSPDLRCMKYLEIKV